MYWRWILFWRWLTAWIHTIGGGLLLVPLRICVIFDRAFTRLRGDHRKYILLHTTSALMAHWLQMAIASIRNDPRLQFVVAVPDHAGRDGLKLYAQVAGVRSMTYTQARVRAWDMVLCADHPVPAYLSRRVPAVYTGHSTTVSKMVDGRIHQFNPIYIVRRDGSSRYIRFFVPSMAARTLAIEQCPALTDKLVVVGDLQTERLRQMTVRRNEIRSRMGFDSTDTVVLILSTWGTASLMETMGAKILAAAGALKSSYRFIFNTHPNHWRGETPAAHHWRTELAPTARAVGHVVSPDDDSTESLIAADLCICDHTSLASSYAMLGKPLAVIPIDADRVSPRSIAARFQEILPKLENADDLEQVLSALLTSFPHQSLNAALASETPPVESASENIARVLRELLNLPGESSPPEPMKQYSPKHAA